MPEPSRRYRAFISYSQRNKTHARRLHQALERYRLPKGVEAAVDIKTRKLGRFFRDDEEMGAATDLGAALQGAIADAESLIVVCSPDAARSTWVNEEIIHFKRTGRVDNIFAVVVAGTPNSTDEQECFPPALRYALGDDGTLSDQRAEPLAVDSRKEPFARVLTRLVAGLAQVPFDALWKREQRRAAAQAVTLSLTVFFIALIVGGALTQSLWYPRVDAYWRYERHAHATERLMEAAPGTTFQDCREGSTDCPVMVVIPEGTFLMGEAPEQTTDEQGQAVTAPDERRRVSIRRFAVSQNEITFADWQRCFDAGACGNEMPDRAVMEVCFDEGSCANADRVSWQGDDGPVTNVSWDDAQRYVAWLSRMTGYSYRLLTEAEWEYAARTVTSAEDPRNGDPWSFGNDESRLEDHAWLSTNSDSKPHPVGMKYANSFGLYDMHGNVWEWVQDCIAPYNPLILDGAAAETGAGRQSASETTCERVLRGGSWGSNPQELRSGYRIGDLPDGRGNYYGFRLARTL